MITQSDQSTQSQTLDEQRPVAWMYDWISDGVVVHNWVTTNERIANDTGNGCHNIRPLFFAPIAG